MATIRPQDKPKHQPESKHVQVTVENEDDGDRYRLNAKRSDTLASVIAELYDKKVRRERRDDDRIRCERGAEDVLQFEHLTFEEYLQAGHCPKLRWLFSGGTGGA